MSGPPVAAGDQPGPRLPASGRFLPLLLVLFFGSGCAALIYEIVWFQMLQLVIGSSAISLGVLLGTYMGGMCLGSLALPRIISPRRHPLRVYALLELGIGAIGIIVLSAMPAVDGLYIANFTHGLPGFLLRGAVSGLILLPPTVLMGATLPAIARWVEATPRGVSWLGLFYGGNIAGAVFGCLLAGFYLLRIHDLATATYVAAAVNGTVALLGLALAAFAPHRVASDLSGKAGSPGNSEWGIRNAESKKSERSGAFASEIPNSEFRIPNSGPVRQRRRASVTAVYVVIALSGMSALAAEVIWTRLLSLMLGATVYTFSIILAVFLIGLGLGSGVGAVLSRGASRPRVLLGVCQALLAEAVAWAAYTLAHSLPYWPIDPLLSTSPWYDFQLDLLRCVWAVLPAAVLWGASFPLALAAAAAAATTSTRPRDPGRLVGAVYAANTVGAIVGAVAFSTALIPWVGTQQCQRLLIGISAMAAIVALAPLLIKPAVGIWAKAWTGGGLATAAVATAIVGLAVLLAWTVGEVPGELIAHGRFLPTWRGQMSIIYVGEGMNASVAVSQQPDSVTRSFHVSGKVEASNKPEDMRLQRMLGHLPAMLHPQPRSVLVVGCGAGVTAGSFVAHPDVQRIVLCEMEALIPPLADEYFQAENYGVVRDPRVEIVYDDARHYILTTPEKFDIITSDPIHPWVKGSATLYSTEYFELCKEHLNPGGLVTQWVPLYESDLNTVKSEIATFFQVFPHGTIWGNDVKGKGYDVVLLGQAGAMTVNVDAIQGRLDRDDHKRVAKSLGMVGFTTASDLLATYAGRASDLGPWLEHAEINRDRNLRLQYLAGMGLNCNQSEAIYDGMLVYRTYPEDLFVASAWRKAELKLKIERSRLEP